MGRGIAHVAALAGYQTWLTDVDESTLQKSLTEVEHDLAAAVARGKISEVQRSAALSRLELATDLDSVVHTCDLVIEAVPERMDLKQEVFQGAELKISTKDGKVSIEFVSDDPALHAAAKQLAKRLQSRGLNVGDLKVSTKAEARSQSVTDTDGRPRGAARAGGPWAGGGGLEG